MRPVVTVVALYVCLLVRSVCPAKPDEPIETSFGGGVDSLHHVLTYVGPGFPRHTEMGIDILDFIRNGRQRYGLSLPAL